MRGKEYPTLRDSRELGITPAYAGKRMANGHLSPVNEDHPRICGEKAVTLLASIWLPGSPPHMRGKVLPSVMEIIGTRITPAYAGKSGTRSGCHQAPAGSPPHMRGKAFPGPCGTGPVGITPAYAGKRLKRSRSTVPPVAIVPLFPSVCNKPVVSDGSPAGRDAPLFLPAENAVPASPAYNLRSL